jgi:hypothetical protein
MVSIIIIFFLVFTFCCWTRIETGRQGGHNDDEIYSDFLLLLLLLLLLFVALESPVGFFISAQPEIYPSIRYS